MTPSVIVYGPQGCGKTRHAEALAAHYGLRKIVDSEGMLDQDAMRHRVDALILVQASTPPEFDAGALASLYRIVSFENACAEAGIPR